MRRILTQLMVGKMSLRQRCLSVAAGVSLALIVVVSGMTFSTEAVPTDQLNHWMEIAPVGYCSDDEGPCGVISSCSGECEAGGDCCPVSMRYTPFICLYWC